MRYPVVALDRPITLKAGIDAPPQKASGKSLTRPVALATSRPISQPST
jgi:hypothetical protein